MFERRFNISIMSENEFQCLKLCLNARAFRLLGIGCQKYVQWHTDFRTNEIVFIWE